MGINEIIGIVLKYDLLIITWLQGYAADWLTKTAEVLSFLGEGVILFAIIAFFYWSYDKETGRFIGTNAVAALIAGPMLSGGVKRLRPYMNSKDVKCIRPVNQKYNITNTEMQGYSLPSVTALGSSAVYGTLSKCSRKFILKLLLFVLIIAVGASRVYLGVNYPTDVLAGWAIALIMTAVASALQKSIKSHFTIMLIFGVLALPGWFYCENTGFYMSYGIMIGVLFGFFVESAIVRFPNAYGFIRRLLRFIIGAGVAVGLKFGLDYLLPMIFTQNQLSGAGLIPHIILAGRYFVMAFILTAVYPAFFHLTAKIGRRRGSKPKRVRD